jgi:uroporphyrinogen-III synthase
MTKPATIVVTRPEDDDGPLTRLLHDAGQTVLQWQATAIAPPEDPTALRNILRNIESYDWVVFTSANAVEAVVDILPTAPRRPRIAAVGAATARRLQDAGWTIDLLPVEAGSAQLADALLALRPLPRRVLFPASAVALPTLAQRLREGGVDVDQIDAYRTINRSGPVESWHRALDDRAVDAVTFASPSAVFGLRAALTESYFVKIDGLVISAIGGTTADALRRNGLTVTAVATRSTWEDLAAVTLAALHARPNAPKGLNS